VQKSGRKTSIIIIIIDNYSPHHTYMINYYAILVPVLVVLAYTLPPTVFMHVHLALQFMGCYSLVVPGLATYHSGLITFRTCQPRCLIIILRNFQINDNFGSGENLLAKWKYLLGKCIGNWIEENKILALAAVDNKSVVESVCSTGMVNDYTVDMNKHCRFDGKSWERLMSVDVQEMNNWLMLWQSMEHLDIMTECFEIIFLDFF